MTNIGNGNGSENGGARESHDSLVTGYTSQGTEVRASLARLTHHQAVFEIYSPECALRTSEVLNEFKIMLGDRLVYFGRAVVGGVVNTGMMVMCQVSLNEQSWTVVDFPKDAKGKDRLRHQFSDFLGEWQKLYLVSHDYKVAVADLQSFLTDLQLWLDRVELNLRTSPEAKRAQLQQEIAHELRDSVVPPVNSLFDRFEEVSNRVEAELRPAHGAFGRRQLHPLLLCAPFIYRCYTKPLGYAGDYEMMNMIIRNGYEGGSLFAKLVNSYLLDQAPPHAVRNRVGFLKQKMLEEISRIARQGRMAQIWSVGSGPAREMEEFLIEHALSDQAQFRLLDFNEETLRYAADRLENTRQKHHRVTPITVEKKSVHHLLKANARPASAHVDYDLIYCSGLYDYLSDRVCKSLNNYLYDQLRPGGLLVVGNFAPCTPRQNLMEHLMEWFLIYRDSRQLAALAPDQAAPEECTICAEPTGANIFLEVRKSK